MKTVFKTWNCNQISIGQQYIAALGSGVTILDRQTLKLVHHFDGIRWIHGGIFLSDDILAVYTGEQKVYMLQISKEQIIWACPRPEMLAATGDMRCCAIGDTGKLACIARGRKTLNEHYLLIIDCKNCEIAVRLIDDCHRVVSSLTWTEEMGLTFLSYQADGKNGICYSITKLDDDGNCIVLFANSDHRVISQYSGKHLLFADYTTPVPKIWIHGLEFDSFAMRMKIGPGTELIHDHTIVKNVFTAGKALLPTISWLSPNSDFLVAHMPYGQSWVSVYDLKSHKLLLKETVDNIACGVVVDNRLFIGCMPGLYEMKL